jgi:hypothetical protein
MTEDKTLYLGSSVTILDPCYIPNSMHMETVINITPGVWEPYVEMKDEGSWGTRVATLGITRKGFRTGFGRVVNYAGVDSGQMMIIDTDAISNWEGRDDEKWPFGTGAEPENRDGEFAGELSYFGACQATLSEDQHGILEDLAVVSSSGFGDGSYPIYVFEDTNGQVERIEVRFIEEEDDWDDDWEDEDEDYVEDEW